MPPPPPTVNPGDGCVTPVSAFAVPFVTSGPVTGGRVTGGGCAAFVSTAGFFSGVGTVFAGTFMTSGFAGGTGFAGSGRFGGGAAFSTSRAPIDVVPVVRSPMPDAETDRHQHRWLRLEPRPREEGVHREHRDVNRERNPHHAAEAAVVDVTREAHRRGHGSRPIGGCV